MQQVVIGSQRNRETTGITDIPVNKQNRKQGIVSQVE